MAQHTSTQGPHKVSPSDWRLSDEPPLGSLGRVLAYGLAALALAAGVVFFVQDWRGILALRPIEIFLLAYLPENGGWRSEPLRVEAGRDVLLHVRSVEGVHTFAIARTELQSTVTLVPGATETLRFTAPAPGRYVLYCTTWCSPHHWRMRTVLEVSDPAQPERPLHYVQDLPRYAIDIDPMRLDMPHPAPVWPAQAPDAEFGATLWAALAPSVNPAALLAELGWPDLSPAQLFIHITDGHLAGLAPAAAWPEPDRWALVAYLWRANTTSSALARGEMIYRRNCVECHGATGAGDGFAAALNPVTVPDLTDPTQTAGATPALLYAKIARGGMGTGMPNWGTILSEDDLWAVTDYLMQFMFVRAPAADELPPLP